MLYALICAMASNGNGLGWMVKAACRGKTDLMFPKSFNDKSYVTQARALCRECPVREQCLDYAVQFVASDMHGIWAGCTSAQLAREQRKRGMTEFRPALLTFIHEPGPRSKKRGRPKKSS